MPTIRTAATTITSYVAAGLLFGSAATLALQASSNAQAEAEPQNAVSAVEQVMPPAGAPMSFADLAARLQPAVVNISTTQQVEVRRMPFPRIGPGSPLDEMFRRFQDREEDAEPETREASSLGSGFIISPDGYVVTNNHVVTARSGNDAVESITVTLGEDREYEARVVGRDPLTDLALLKVDGKDLPYVRFGRSDSVRVGDWVVAIGNPFGLGGTVTAGIVSALHRDIRAGQFDRFIQTDASINQGNSGGPMFDLAGNVIGINTAIFSPTGGNVGIGFAIPASQAQPVIDQLRKMGRVRRGYLGVSIQRLDDDLASGLGLESDAGEIVAGVEPGGPADKAGIKQGDVIVKVNGQDVTARNNLSFLVSNSAIGSRVPIELIRSGKRKKLTATLAERPSENQIGANANGDPDVEADDSAPGAESARKSLGISLADLTPEIRQQLRLSDDIEGVVVAGVDRRSDAARKGIGRGSIIISINDQTTRTPAEAAAAVASARESGRNTVAILVKRRGDNAPIFIGVEMMAQDKE
ncbi:Do family serine endopeptidase [Pacificimonas sp. WHA3]|uniref:Do family serine endopeptidase n=1 Tax=Pacificimonas pallii TaxID=2827236 RepID=A0ABS6SHV7_9SPHN|nr:Do family serine endopeptidase [Pacificimonas pallii]MBV7257628.1 Do family serine endopeptidase [Pacificimonas pallii]